MDALKDIPEVEGPLQTGKGEATLQKTDIFRKIMWFGFAGESSWHPIPTSRVLEIIELNKRGEKPDNLQEDNDSRIEIAQAITSDLERLDKKYQGKRKKKKKKKRKSGNRRFPGKNDNPETI